MWHLGKLQVCSHVLFLPSPAKQELVIFSATHRLFQSCDKQCHKNHNPEFYCEPHHSWTLLLWLQLSLLNIPTIWINFLKSIFKSSCFKYYRQNIWLWRIIWYTDCRGSKIQFRQISRSTLKCRDTLTPDNVQTVHDLDKKKPEYIYSCCRHWVTTRNLSSSIEFNSYTTVRWIYFTNN